MKIKNYNQCKKTIDCSQCISYEFCSSWVTFVKSHGYLKHYIHFDEKVSLGLKTIRKYVLDPRFIAKHSFYPFIHFTKTQSRFAKSLKLEKYIIVAI